MAGPVLLERERELAELAQAAREAAAGEGGLVLILGEAGIGKSSLVRALHGLLPANERLLVGHCDDLGTARTPGPFRDLIGSVGTGLTRALREGGERDAVLTALRSELDWAGHPTVLVVEDVHWADEATLDVLRFLARRIVDLPAVLVLTYRDDELTREHPLQQLLGQASASGRARRLPLRRLSEQAVRQLGAASPVDARQVFAMTSGNPFFVAEVLAAGDGDRVPSTIVDAVLGRVRRLDAATQDALEQLAVVPSVVERWLVDALVAGGLAALVAAEEHGLLTVSPASVAFRHELARRAIADSVPVARRVELNRRVLHALVGREDADLSRIVHHAAQAGDADAIVRYGPPAARDAAGAGAHREAVAHYRLVVRHRERFAPAELAELLEGYAVECYTVGATEAPIVESEAVELRRSLGDQRALGTDLRWLSRMRLFERSGRRLRVTAAAEPVVAAARQVLAAADEVVRAAQRAADGRTGRLAIAVRTGSSPLLLMDVLAAFRRHHPDVETSITELTDDQLHHGLREGRLDVALVRIAAPDDLPHQVLMKEPLRLVVSSHHRLAGAERARIGDLAGERVVFYGRSVQPVAHHWLTQQLRAAGLSTVLQEATLPNILATVAAGLAVSVLVSAYESILRPPGIRFIPLNDLTVDLIMVWGPGPESPALRAFRRELKQAMHTGTTPDSP